MSDKISDQIKDDSNEEKLHSEKFKLLDYFLDYFFKEDNNNVDLITSTIDALVQQVDNIETPEEQYEHITKILRLSSRNEDRNQKKKVVSWIKWVVGLWLMFVVVLISSLTISSNDTITPGVIITLLGTTTLNILILSHVMAKHFLSESRVDNSK